MTKIPLPPFIILPLLAAFALSGCGVEGDSNGPNSLTPEERKIATEAITEVMKDRVAGGAKYDEDEAAVRHAHDRSMYYNFSVLMSGRTGTINLPRPGNEKAPSHSEPPVPIAIDRAITGANGYQITLADNEMYFYDSASHTLRYYGAKRAGVE